MKKTILTTVLGLITFFSSYGQSYFSCNYRQICDWNSVTETHDKCGGYEEASLFKINKDETLFTHTTDDIKSTYYINSREYDKVKDIWIYNVTSDVGNNYLYVFDPKNDEIRVLILYKDDTSRLIRFFIKKIWTD